MSDLAKIIVAHVLFFLVFLLEVWGYSHEAGGD